MENMLTVNREDMAVLCHEDDAACGHIVQLAKIMQELLLQNSVQICVQLLGWWCKHVLIDLSC